MHERGKKALVATAFVLFSVMVLGFVWLLTNPLTTAGAALAYAAGLSMIFLPCTSPLVFIIVPMALSKSPWKGLSMALAFGAGITLTLMGYAIAVSLAGAYIGLNTVIRTMFVLAGLAAIVFGLTELHLFRIHLPHKATPNVLRDRGPVLRAFGLGLLLGNAGVGCPNPAFYVLLAYWAGVGSITEGAVQGFLHGLGRVTPLIFLTILAILGVNATRWAKEKQEVVRRGMGWGLLAVGGFILAIGWFGMAWWERSIIHEAWNKFFLRVAPSVAESQGAADALGISASPSYPELLLPWLPWVFAFSFLVVAILWDRTKHNPRHRRRKKDALLVAMCLILLAAPVAGAHVAEREPETQDIGPYTIGFLPAQEPVLVGREVEFHLNVTLDGQTADPVLQVWHDGEPVALHVDEPGTYGFYATPESPGLHEVLVQLEDEEGEAAFGYEAEGATTGNIAHLTGTFLLPIGLAAYATWDLGRGRTKRHEDATNKQDTER